MFCCCSCGSNSVPPSSMLECISCFFTFAMHHRFAMRFCIGNCCHVFVKFTSYFCSAIKFFLAILNLILPLYFITKILLKLGTSQLKTVKSLLVCFKMLTFIANLRSFYLCITCIFFLHSSAKIIYIIANRWKLILNLLIIPFTIFAVLEENFFLWSLHHIYFPP